MNNVEQRSKKYVSFHMFETFNPIFKDNILVQGLWHEASGEIRYEAILAEDKNGNQKILDKVGEKWSAFQTINFKNNSQPYYVLLSPELELLNKPLQYTDTETYYSWLDEGLKNFKSKVYFLYMLAIYPASIAKTTDGSITSSCVK